MRQSAVDRAVARATGEPLAVVRRRGFSIAAPPPPRRARPRLGRNPC